MENIITLYTVAEVSKILRVGKRKVYDAINAGVLPAIKIGGLKVTSQALNQFLSKYQNCNIDDPHNITPLEFKNSNSKRN